MILSHSHKFFFIHIYKTGGTSIRKALQKYDHKYNFLAACQSMIKKGAFVDQSIVHKHASVLKIREKLSDEVFSNYCKFAVVRNPFDWQVSLYHYILRKETNDHPHWKIIKNLKNFDEYVEWRVKEEPENQAKYLVDEKGEILVDHILKFENLNRDFVRLCDKLKIKPKNLPTLNKTNHKDYRSYYNDSTKELFESAYAKDLELFNYSY